MKDRALPVAGFFACDFDRERRKKLGNASRPQLFAELGRVAQKA